MGCGVIQNPKDILGFAERELSLPPAGHGTRMCPCGSGRAQGCPLCWVLLCPVGPHGDVPAPSGPTGHPLSSIPRCHPQGHTMLRCPCRPCGWRTTRLQATDRQQVRDAARVISFLHGFWGAVFLPPCPWQLDCGTEGGTPVTLPSPPALPPAACPQPSRGRVPFSVRK